MAPCLSIENLTFYRKRKKILNNIGLEIPQGEVFGLLGANGAGKTTLFKLLLNLLPPKKGKVAIFGRSQLLPQTRNRISYLAESWVPYPQMTIAQLMKFLMGLRGLWGFASRSQITTLLTEAGLSLSPQTPLTKLSKGQWQRVALCQILLQVSSSKAPQLILLDEPFSGLDPVSTDHFQKTFSLLAQQGHTLIINGHLLGELAEILTSYAIIHHGQLLAQSSWDKDRPAQELKATFLSIVGGAS